MSDEPGPRVLWKERPVPRRHRVAPNVLGAISALGVPFIARGLVVRDRWMVLFGLSVQVAGKIWFLDRMALLHDDMAPAGASPRDRPSGSADGRPPAGIDDRASVGDSR